MMQANPDGCTFKIKELKKAKQSRYNISCLVNIKDNYLLIIGGSADITKK